MPHSPLSGEAANLGLKTYALLLVFEYDFAFAAEVVFLSGDFLGGGGLVLEVVDFAVEVDALGGLGGELLVELRHVVAHLDVFLIDGPDEEDGEDQDHPQDDIEKERKYLLDLQLHGTP